MRVYNSQWAREYYLKNRNLILKRCKNYREKNKLKIQSYNQRYRQAHKSSINTKRKESYDKDKKKIYYDLHQPKILEYQKRYRNVNRIQRLKYLKEYREKNKEALRMKQKNNRLYYNRYEANKIRNDEKFAVLNRLRHRIRQAFKAYSQTGKIMNSHEYGIDYKAIFKYLGPCPGNRNLYHIDHKKALCHFDLTNPEEIQIAFAPENHQWLLAEENLSKGKK